MQAGDCLGGGRRRKRVTKKKRKRSREKRKTPMHWCTATIPPEGLNTNEEKETVKEGQVQRLLCASGKPGRRNLWENKRKMKGQGEGQRISLTRVRSSSMHTGELGGVQRRVRKGGQKKKGAEKEVRNRKKTGYHTGKKSFHRIRGHAMSEKKASQKKNRKIKES